MSSLHQARSGLGVVVVGGMVYAIGGKSEKSLGVMHVSLTFSLNIGTQP